MKPRYKTWIVIYKYFGSQHPAGYKIKKEKRSSLSVTGLHLLSRTPLAQAYILICLIFISLMRVM